MSEKKNIDKLFKEKLKDFEAVPNDAVWERIEQSLHKDKKKRRVIPIWWKVAGVAAVLALLFTLSKTVFDDSSNMSIDPKTVDTEKSTTDDKDNTPDPSDLNTSKSTDNTSIVNDDTSDDNNDVTPEDNIATPEKSNNAVVNSNVDKTKDEQTKKNSVLKHKSQKANAVAQHNNTQNKTLDNKVSNTNKTTVANQSNDKAPNKELSPDNPIQKEKSELDKLIKDAKQSNDTRVATNETSEKENTNSTIDSSQIKDTLKEENAIEKAIAEAQKEEDIDDPEESFKRWSIAPNAAPVYFNTLGKGSSIDDQFVNNTKEGDVSVSYGVRGSYALNKKLKIRAGINKVDLGYSTNNILVFDGAGRNAAVSSNLHLNNIKFHDTIVGNNAYVSANTVSFTTGPEILFTKEQGSINQQLGFIEVPIEIEYSLIDKKFGVNLIGGFSTLFLSNNEVYAVQNNGERTFLGEATNINDMSYSANFGVGFNYNISEKLRLNLEPTFKYQINTFNDTSGDFQPFFIGVYSGLSFKF